MSPRSKPSTCFNPNLIQLRVTSSCVPSPQLIGFNPNLIQLRELDVVVGAHRLGCFNPNLIQLRGGARPHPQPPTPRFQSQPDPITSCAWHQYFGLNSCFNPNLIQLRGCKPHRPASLPPCFNPNLIQLRVEVWIIALVHPLRFQSQPDPITSLPPSSADSTPSRRVSIPT